MPEYAWRGGGPWAHAELPHRAVATWVAPSGCGRCCRWLHTHVHVVLASLPRALCSIGCSRADICSAMPLASVAWTDRRMQTVGSKRGPPGALHGGRRPTKRQNNEGGGWAPVNPKPSERRPCLLHRLVAADVRQDRNLLLQVIRCVTWCCCPRLLHAIQHTRALAT